MSLLIKHHPSLTRNQDILDICKPLKQLNISYFAHVQIDMNNQFSALASNAAFTEHYLQNQYYNVDIHMAQNTQLGTYVIWDMIERKSLSAKMHKEAGEFGIKHTFTIIEKNAQEKNYYHFASATPSLTINQTYLANLDLLKLFIEYFKEKIQNSRELSQAYKLKFKIASNAEGYLLSANPKNINKSSRECFIKSLSPSVVSKNGNPFTKNSIILKNCFSHKTVKLSPQQEKCLRLLSVGYTNKQIATQLSLSTRTVENYFSHIRTLLNCNNSKELIALYYSII